MIKPSKLIRRKLCKGCREFYRPEENHPPFRDWCSVGCGVTISTKRFTVIEKKKKKANRKAVNDLNRKDRKRQLDLTKTVVQKFVRLRDKGLPCISCGTTKDVQYCAGHYKTAGGHPELALEPLNINLQCNRNCNCCLSGNIEGTKQHMGIKKELLRDLGKKGLIG